MKKLLAREYLITLGFKPKNEHVQSLVGYGLTLLFNREDKSWIASNAAVHSSPIFNLPELLKAIAICNLKLGIETGQCKLRQSLQAG